MSKPINYRVISKNFSEIVQSDRTEFMPNTGQTLFYLNNVMMHIAPADAFVTNINKEIYLKEKFNELEYFLSKSNNEIEVFWKGFLERNRSYDAPEDKISVEDSINRKNIIEKSKFINELQKFIPKQ